MTDLPLHERLAKAEARIAALESERLQVTNVERLAVGPDDVLFVHLREDVTQGEMDEAARVIAETIGTRRVLMLAGDMRVSVAPLPVDQPTVLVCPLCGGAGCEQCRGAGVLDA
jgi:hypothetical protein